MPNQDDSIILTQTHSSVQTDYSYGLITGLDDTRSDKSQLIFLYIYPQLGDGATNVADVTWSNWYDPYIIPDSLITVDQSIKKVTVGDTSTVTVTAANGAQYQMPAFAPGGASQFRIDRSQDISNRASTFSAGSRITSDGLNKAIDQVFRSVQELTDRTTELETSGTGGGGTVEGVEEAPIDGNQYARQDGTWSVVTGTGGGGDANLDAELVSTETLGGITAGDTFAAGDPIEDVLRSLLITYQAPAISGLNPLGSEIEIGSAYTVGTITFSVSNRENAQAAATMLFRRGSTTLNTENIALTGTSGTAAQSHNFSPAATGTYDIPSGNTQQYSVRVTGTNTESGSFTATDTLTVKYRSFAFASTSATTAGAVSSIESGYDDLTTGTNVNLTVNGASSGGNYSWIAFPAVYFSGTPSISVTDTSTGFAATYNYIGDENYTNANGVVVSMSLFRSPFADSVAEGTIMDVS